MAQIAHPRHVAFESREVETVLGLHEPGARIDLAPETQGPVVEGRGEGVGRGPEKEFGRLVEPAARCERALIAHGADDPERSHAVEIEDRLGLRLIAALHPVAGKAEDIRDTHRRSREHIALDRDPVSVACRDLHDRRIADACQQGTHPQTRHVAVGTRTVRGVDRVDPAIEDRGAVEDIHRIGGVGRREFRGDGEFARPQDPLETAARGVSRQGFEPELPDRSDPETSSRGTPGLG